MQIKEFNDEILEGITIPGLSQKENLLVSAMSLLRRAVILNDASWMLELPYTYKIVNPGATKVAAREQIGKMAADVIDVISDDLLKAGFSRYLQHLGYSVEQSRRILDGPSMDTIENSIITNPSGFNEVQGSSEV